VLERITSVLTEPDRIFSELASEAPRLGVAYMVVVLQSLAAGLASTVALYSNAPEMAQARAMIEQAGVDPPIMFVAVVLVTPLSALFTWALNWFVLRIGSETSERLWETAAWSQLPTMVSVPLATAFGTAGVLVGTIASMLGIVWCAWLVHSGVGRLSDGNARRATIVYCAIWLGLSLLRILIGDTGTPTSTPRGGAIL
jgi:hypothetical protein